MKNNLFKKSMSVFLSVLMLLTCWVWVAPTEADAISGTVYGKPEMNGGHYNAGTTNAYGTPVFSGYTDRTFTWQNGDDWTTLYYPSHIYLDKSESLEAAGYYFNVQWHFGDGANYRILLGANVWGDNTQWDSYGDGRIRTMNNIFPNYSVDASCTDGYYTLGDGGPYNGGSNFDLRIVGYGYTSQGTDGFSRNNTRHDKYILFRSRQSTNNATIYLKGNPSSSYVGKTTEYNTSGGSFGSYGLAQNYSGTFSKSWKVHSNGSAQFDSKGSSSSYMEGQWIEMAWNVTIYDKSSLNSTITSAESTYTDSTKYTSASWTAYQTALTNAKNVLKTREVTQSDLTAAENNLKANYPVEKTFTIIWKNGDTTLETDTGVRYGATPTYNGSTPTKAADAQYTYTFSGWNPSITAAINDATYNAQFTTTVNNYTVTFNYANGTQASSNVYAYGTPAASVSVPANTPADYDETNHYAYSWPVVNAVTGNAAYAETKSATAHSFTSSVTKPSSCTAEGERTYSCACGYSYTEAIGKADHTTATRKENEISATCGADGSYSEVTYCTVCNAVLSSKTVTTPATGNHTYEWIVDADATCGASGLKHEKCINCTATRSEGTVIPATGAHTEVTVAGKDANCTETGLTDGKKCSVCDVVIVEQQEIPALGHEWDDGVIAPAPTCTDKGVKTYTCEVCGETKTEAISANGHTAGEAVTENNVAPDCVKDGSYDTVIYCSVCNAELDRDTTVVPALGHKEAEAVIENNIAPDCVKDGSYDTVVYCSVCNEELDRETTVVPALGHKEGEAVIENNVAPDCVKDGSYDTVVYCSVCNEELDRKTTVVPALGHKEGEAVIENNVAPDCVKDGSYDTVIYCAVCNEELDRKTTVVTALGHKYVGFTTDPTCTEDGYTTYTCSVCGDSYVADEVAALGHEWDDGVIDPTPTCTDKGVKTYTCEVCGETKTEEISANGHTAGEAVTENNVAPDCVKDGSYDTVVYCSVCNAELDRKTTVVTALGHKEGEAVIENNVAPDCVNDGSYDTVVYCSVCGEELSRVTTTVDALGHKAAEAVTENNVDPDCVNNGSYDTVVYCSVCNEELDRDTTVVPALGHKEAEAVIENDVKPDCVNNGSYDTVVYCSVCGEELSRVTTTVDALGHKYEGVTTDPDCINGGYTTYTCSVCGDSYVDDEVDALGHNEVTDEAVAPTCTESGLTEGKHCDRCGEVIIAQTEVSATGHTFPEKPTKVISANCVSGKTYIYKCNNCDETKTEVDGSADSTAPHTAYVSEYIAPTCDGMGFEVYTCSLCGERVKVVQIPATGHADNDGDGICDADGCGVEVKNPDEENKACGCICHKENWLMRLIYKILRFFWNLFGIGKSCDCGTMHY